MMIIYSALFNCVAYYFVKSARLHRGVFVCTARDFECDILIFDY